MARRTEIKVTPMTPKPVQLEIIAHVPGSLNFCSRCQGFIDNAGVGRKTKQADLDSYPPEFMADWQRLSALVLALSERYPGRLVIKIIDVQSPRGLWLALRRGVRRYPTFILAGEKYQGWISEAGLTARLDAWPGQPASTAR
jgi:hypothetical protein